MAALLLGNFFSLHFSSTMSNFQLAMLFLSAFWLFFSSRFSREWTDVSP
jgi:uncharacterized membrane protein